MNARRFSILTLIVALAGLSAASASPIEVNVLDPGGKLVSRAKMNSAGAFATPALSGGNYVLQLRSTTPITGKQFDISVASGRKKASAEAIPGEKFAGSGIGLKIDVTKGMSISGRVAAAVDNPSVKWVNGHKYIWVQGSTGSNISGRWLPEEEARGAANRNLGTIDKGSIQWMWEKAYNPQGN